MSKEKKCAVCKKPYKQFSSIQTWCSPDCGYILAKHREGKRVKSEAKVWRKETRDRKLAMKTKAKWIEDAQINSCNPYIRLRDKDQPCISCGKFDHEIEDVYVGGKWDAGHFKSRGGFPELRFHPMNIHKQCKSCNGGSGKFAKKDRTVAQNYRINLIARIGKEMVEWLEGPQEAQHLTIDDIIDIKSFYKEQSKLLR